jgi:trk system potassium uptake protein TrkH
MQDLDHTSYALRMWRFILPYVGGQGMILIALTFLIWTSGVYGMYVGEGREDRILPNVVHTTRIIWGISVGYFCIGTMILWLANISLGFSILEAFWQWMWLFMGSWSTSGFASQSISILYYHSLTIELITMTIFIIGSFNFAIHYSLISGNRKEIYRNIESIVFCITFLIIFFIITNVLSQQEVYANFAAFLRNTFYIVASAHTTTGHTTLYSP